MMVGLAPVLWMCMVSLLFLAAMPASGRAGACPNPLACEIAGKMAAAIGERGDAAFGGGLEVRAVRAEGPLLVVEVTAPAAAVGRTDERLAEISSTQAKGFRRGFCQGPEAQALLDIGVRIRMRLFSNDGVLMADTVIDSCEGLL